MGLPLVAARPAARLPAGHAEPGESKPGMNCLGAVQHNSFGRMQSEQLVTSARAASLVHFTGRQYVCKPGRARPAPCRSLEKRSTPTLCALRRWQSQQGRLGCRTARFRLASCRSRTRQQAQAAALPQQPPQAAEPWQQAARAAAATPAPTAVQPGAPTAAGCACAPAASAPGSVPKSAWRQHGPPTAASAWHRRMLPAESCA